MADQQVKLRPRKNLNRPKVGKPTARTCSSPASNHRTLPNSNKQAPANPATVADSELGDIVIDDCNNGSEIPASTPTAERKWPGRSR